MNLNVFKTTVYTCFALIAFAGNSILCRLALGEGKIDAASFTIIRLLSGIIILLLITHISPSHANSVTKKNWISSTVLFLYAVTFSYAYISLDTGTGALILFGAVQITMVLASLLAGKKLHVLEVMGVATAFLGFIYLVKPSLSTPSITGFGLMTIAGIAWGIYTLRGKNSKQPINDSAINFLYTLPFISALLIIEFENANLSQQGIMIATVSGALASGIGYTVWYTAVRKLSTMQTSVVQLLVPIVAALGGVIFAREAISMRLVLSSTIILGGIFLVLLGQYFLRQSTLNESRSK